VPLDEGNGGGTGVTLLQLHPGARGRWLAVRRAAASQGAAARSEEIDNGAELGWSGPRTEPVWSGGPKWAM
jgi:hypothetical protein